jgi:hypothetical protein
LSFELSGLKGAGEPMQVCIRPFLHQGEGLGEGDAVGLENLSTLPAGVVMTFPRGEGVKN